MSVSRSVDCIALQGDVDISNYIYNFLEFVQSYYSFVYLYLLPSIIDS